MVRMHPASSPRPSSCRRKLASHFPRAGRGSKIAALAGTRESLAPGIDREKQAPLASFNFINFRAVRMPGAALRAPVRLNQWHVQASQALQAYNCHFPPISRGRSGAMIWPSRIVLCACCDAPLPLYARVTFSIGNYE